MEDGFLLSKSTNLVILPGDQALKRDKGDSKERLSERLVSKWVEVGTGMDTYSDHA